MALLPGFQILQLESSAKRASDLAGAPDWSGWTHSLPPPPSLEDFDDARIENVRVRTTLYATTKNASSGMCPYIQ
jgi:hypothetical protein